MGKTIRAAQRLVAMAVVCLAAAAPAWAQTNDPQLARAASAVQVDPALDAQLANGGSARVLVYLRERPDFSQLPTQASDRAQRGRQVVSALQSVAQRSQQRVVALLKAQRVEHQAFWIDNVIVVPAANAGLVQALKQFSEVALVRAAPEIILYDPPPADTGGMGAKAAESSLSRIKVPDAWALGFQGNGIVVGNIDTGVRYTHAALVGKYRGNLGGGLFDHDYNWWDPYAGSVAPEDTHDHGSHTMGTMVGDDGIGNQIGAAPGAKWIACKGFTPSATDAGLLSCAQFMAAPTDLAGANPDPGLRPHVVNNSWGDCGRSYDGWYQGVIDSWHAAGIHPVFSAGNSSNCSYSSPPGLNTVGNPARYGNVTAVGSTGTSNGLYATHSNWGPTDNLDTVNPVAGHANIKPQVAAPGVSIRSALRGGDTVFGLMSGTSMSAPAVTGVIALLFEAGPCLAGDYATTESLLEGTATATPYASNNGDEGAGNVPNHATGWGEVDALAAVQIASELCDANATLVGTVTDADTGLPLQGVQVRAAATPPPWFTTTTAANGGYSRSVPSGTLTVEFSLDGYATQTLAAVAIADDQQLVLDIELVPLPLVQLSGTVTDAVTGWPLHARIDIETMPGVGTWSDPADGSYSVQVYADVAHDVTATAWSGAYAPLTQPVGPLAIDGIADFALTTASACDAPWAAQVLAPETFDATTTPAGWSVGDGIGNSQVWRFDDHGGRGNLTGGAGGFAIINSDAYGSGGTQNTTLQMPLLDLTGRTQPVLQFNTDFRYLSGEFADIDVSVDGTTWTNVWRRTASYRGPRTERVELAAVAGNPAARVRFHYHNAVWEWWWQVDNVQVLDCGAPPSGYGLVYGNVSDANLGNDLANAVLTSGLQSTISQATADPAQPDGFYVLYLPAGTHDVEVALAPYATRTVQVTAVSGTAVRADVALETGFLSVDPAPVVAVAVTGTSTIVPGVLDNTGGTSLDWNVSRVPGHLLMPNATAPVADSEKGSDLAVSLGIDAGTTVLPTATRGARALPGPTALDAWEALPPLPLAVSRPAGATVGGRFYVIGGESDGGGLAGAVQVFDPATGAWTAGPAMPAPASNACAAAVGDDIYVIGSTGGFASTALQVFDTGTDSWSTVTTDPLPDARYGVACAVLDGRLYVLGGLNAADAYQNTAFVFDPAAADGARWTTLDAGPLAAGFGGAVAIGDRVFWAGMRNATPDLANVLAYVPGTGWVAYPSLTTARGGAGVWARGAQLLVGNGGWASYLTSVEVYDTTLGTGGTWTAGAALLQGRRALAAASAGESGRLYVAGGWAGGYVGTAEQSRFDVNLPWLWTDPAAGTVGAATSAPQDIHLDASTLAPGEYLAQLIYETTSPYPSRVVNVTFTVAEPPPVLTAIAPATGLTTGGTAVEITGSAFQLAGTTQVTIGGAACTGVVVVDTGHITCTTPASAVDGAVDVSVTNPDGQVGTLVGGFAYQYPAPQLTAVTPEQGPQSGGHPVTLTGSGFLAFGTTTVSFGGLACTAVTVDSPTAISCTTPAHAAGVVSVTVTNPDGQQAVLAAGYTYLAPPTVTAIAPATGLTTGGTAVEITGSAFQLAGTTQVTIGGAACTGVVVVDTGHITCTTPASAVDGAVDVSVTNPDGQAGTLAGGFAYQYPAPQLTAVTPNEGTHHGGRRVALSGSGFLASGTTAVTFDGLPCTAVTVDGPATISCTTPAHAAGVVSVTVTNPDGQQAVLADGYAYVVLPDPLFKDGFED